MEIVLLALLLGLPVLYTAGKSYRKTCNRFSMRVLKSYIREKEK
jgi:hypothetical protein